MLEGVYTDTLAIHLRNIRASCWVSLNWCLMNETKKGEPQWIL
jgi:hypothetical protein